MILMPDLFSFAYVPNWYSQLDMLAEMALPDGIFPQGFSFGVFCGVALSI